MKSSGGFATLSGVNTYTGLTQVNGGTLEAATSSALPSYSTANTISVSSGATLAVNVNGWTPANLQTLAGSAAIAAGGYLGLDTGASNFVTSSSFAAIGAGAGAGGLQKLGSGMLTLSGSNSYSGPTLISAARCNWPATAPCPPTRRSCPSAIRSL